MKKTRRIWVRTPSQRYAALCGRGLLAQAGMHVSRLGRPTGIFLLSSPQVWKHWGRTVAQSFRRGGGCRAILFDDRESAKNLRTVERICRALIRAGADRGAVIVALGGGVVGDVAGFVAASYERGVSLVHIPTTLVAQVDSAIGGKTGVNLPEGKNLVGAFYQPRLVLADRNTLTTLPLRQYRQGLYEVIKYGVIGDPELFRYLEKNVQGLLRRDAASLAWVIHRCIRTKARVVSRDERESGLREVLNFGHTFGHALESATAYRKFLHGEAVGWGMIAATILAAALGRLDAGPAARIIRLVTRVGALPRVSGIAAGRVLEAMRADKKARGGKLRFTLPTAIGRVETITGVREALVRRVLDELASLAEQAK